MSNLAMYVNGFSPRAVSCSSCPAGTTSAEGASQCSMCAAGSYSGIGQAACTPCAAGTVNPLPGKAECQRCSSSQFQNVTGQSMTSSIAPLLQVHSLLVCSIAQCRSCTETLANSEPKHFASDGITCFDSNECRDPRSCAVNSRCINLRPSFSCACRAGFEPDGGSGCRDINECLASPCHSNATCTNFEGSFGCQCKANYVGDGKVNCTSTLTSLTSLAGAKEVLNSLITSATAAPTIGDGICDPSKESCASSPDDCGRCDVIPSEPVTIAVQFQADPRGKGAGFVQVRPPSADPGSWRAVALSEDAVDSVIEALEGLDQDPFAASSGPAPSTTVRSPFSGMPEGKKFSGVSLVVDRIGGASARRRRAVDPADCLELLFDVSMMSLATGNVTNASLHVYDELTALWALVPFPVELIGNLNYRGYACDSGQYSLLFDFERNTALQEAILANFESQLDLIPTQAPPAPREDGSQPIVVDEAQENAAADAAASLMQGLDQLENLLGATLDEGESVTISTSTLNITVLRTSAENISSPSTAIEIPADLGAQVSATLAATCGTSSACRNVNVGTKQYANNPFAWGDLSNSIFGTVLDFAIKDSSGNRLQVDLGSSSRRRSGGGGVLVTVARDPQADEWQRQCVRWDPDARSPSCSGGDTSARCTGAWTTDGMKIVEVRDDTMICEMASISSKPSGASASIDLTLLAPKVDLTNFDVANSYIIYSVFGSFFFVVGCLYLYAHVERKAYDRYQEGVRLGDIDPFADDAKIASIGRGQRYMLRLSTWLKRSFVGRVLVTYGNMLKSKHPWLAVWWPASVQVRPKRVLKIASLAASICMVGWCFDELFKHC